MQFIRYVCGRRYLLCIFFCLCSLYVIINMFCVIKRNSKINDTVDLIPMIPIPKTSATYETADIHWTKPPNETNCHYSVEDDALLSVEGQKLTNGDKAIFFHETSCRGGLNSRQACSIESAARLHPNWQVNILFSSPIPERILRNSSLTKLLQLKNVKMFRLHIAQYGLGTVVEDIIKNRLKESLHPMEHTSDILRLLTLYKYGGVYLDTDSVLIKNLEELPPNWIGKESDEHVASGAMAFTKDGVGRNLTTAVLTEIRDSFKPESWSYNGPQAILRVLDKWCPNAVKANTDCKGIKIFSTEYFYPIYYTDHKKYFENGVIEDKKKSYMHHMWNYLTKDIKIQKDSPYAKIAKRFCPAIYKRYGDQFGDLGY